MDNEVIEFIHEAGFVSIDEFSEIDEFWAELDPYGGGGV